MDDFLQRLYQGDLTPSDELRDTQAAQQLISLRERLEEALPQSDRALLERYHTLSRQFREDGRAAGFRLGLRYGMRLALAALEA